MSVDLLFLCFVLPILIIILIGAIIIECALYKKYFLIGVSIICAGISLIGVLYLNKKTQIFYPNEYDTKQMQCDYEAKIEKISKNSISNIKNGELIYKKFLWKEEWTYYIIENKYEKYEIKNTNKSTNTNADDN